MQSACSNLRTKLNDQLETRIGALSKLSRHVDELATGQCDLLGKLVNMRCKMAEEEGQFVSQQVLGVEKVVKEERRAAEEMRDEEMTPLLDEVATIIRGQVEELEKLKEVVERDVLGLVAKVEAWSIETVSNVTSIKTQVERYANSNEARMEKLQSKNKEIVASEASVKKLLEALVEGYSKHAAVVSGNTKIIEEETVEDLKEVKQLVKSSGQAVTEVEEKREVVEKKINQEKERISLYVQEKTTTCRRNNEDVLEKGERMEELTKVQVEATKVRWAAHEEASEERVANHKRLAEEKMEEFKRVVVDGEQKLKVSGISLKKQVEEVKDTEEAAVRRLATEVDLT